MTTVSPMSLEDFKQAAADSSTPDSTLYCGLWFMIRAHSQFTDKEVKEARDACSNRPIVLQYVPEHEILSHRPNFK